MCLGVPGRILEIDGLTARVEFWGVEREVRLDVVDTPVAPGDYVLNHVGFAIRRIPEEEVAETLALYDQILSELEREDLMAADVRGELGLDGGDAKVTEVTGGGGGGEGGDAAGASRVSPARGRAR